jgi:hypothetical protein
LGLDGLGEFRIEAVLQHHPSGGLEKVDRGSLAGDDSTPLEVMRGPNSRQRHCHNQPLSRENGMLPIR